MKILTVMDRKKTKINQVIQFISEKIKTYEILPGSKLPSLRVLAKQLNLSVSTVLEAYERMLADGQLEVRHGSGYFVKNTSYIAINHSTTFEHIESDPFWVAHQSLMATKECLTPSCGWLPLDWLPESHIKKSLKELSQSSSELLLSYSSVLGYTPLRKLLSKKSNDLGAFTHHDHILLTDSATQALDMICRVWLKAGDTVLVDDPCYFNFFSLMNLHGIHVISIPFTQHGPDVEQFLRAMKQSPKMYITSSGVHNPTGASINIGTAHKVLKIAEEHHMLIVEDDVYCDFERVPAPRYALLSNFEHVIQIGSFSKSLSASFRCGYIIAKPEHIAVLAKIKIASNFNNSQLNAVLVHHILKDVQYRRHLEAMQHRLSYAKTHTVQQLKLLGIEPWIIPKAGMFLWCKLPTHISAHVLAKQCRDDGLILVTGCVFSQSDNADQFIRFNVSHCLDQRVFDILKKNMH
ncbi:PLP-dependent aminotransferase family protein [Acinetobacter sp. B10A]|uniref:aminotransferase-like domain-containing protein n=1 Tax=Acinetobacter baretiae TaxID=2605383 RepID=UPI001B3C7B9B|nr:PLP-dependent aminotransferase family protein [Acinetobacter baretiae]MBF7684244.1 PLP-dependent aminotransferase family protein [Acinetobacter baretiae]